MDQHELIHYCNSFLNIDMFEDYCPNGLQVEGDNRTVHTIALGVSITLELIEKAIRSDADLIITHHGLLWNNDDRCIKGPLRNKLARLFDHGIAAAAYHLPLDFHPEIGNNVQLAHKIGLTDLSKFAETAHYAEAIMGRPSQTTILDLSKHIEKVLKRKPTVLPFGEEFIDSVAVITGGAQGFFLKAIEAGADCFITGEISEKNFAMSQEYGVHFISAGHYATEQFGIQALGSILEKEFDLSCQFIPIQNPI
jgi:dinuclear metal center YbgI/SA1388 family protein